MPKCAICGTKTAKGTVCQSPKRCHWEYLRRWGCWLKPLDKKRPWGVCVTCGGDFPIPQGMGRKQACCPAWLNPECAGKYRHKMQKSPGPGTREKLYSLTRGQVCHTDKGECVKYGYCLDNPSNFSAAGPHCYREPKQGYLESYRSSGIGRFIFPRQGGVREMST